MARTAHNRRLHRKKDREPRGISESTFIPVADEMIRSLREHAHEHDAGTVPGGGLPLPAATPPIVARRTRPS